MKDHARKLAKESLKFQKEGNINKAGDLYTAAAHEYAGEVTEHIFPEPDRTRDAITELAYAATCYRLIGDDFRVQNRCDLGILLAEDYFEFIDRQEFEAGSFADLRRGAWPEFIGDLRVIAHRESADDAYEQAIEIYRSAGDWPFAYGEQEHMRLAGFYRNVRRGLGHDIPMDAPEQQSLNITFSEWVEYKRERLPDLLEQLEQQGEWPL